VLFARQWQRMEIEEVLQFLDRIMSLPGVFEDRINIEWQDLASKQAMAQMLPPIIWRAQARGEAIGRRDTHVYISCPYLARAQPCPIDAGRSNRAGRNPRTNAADNQAVG
jgi:hypothetical protein